MKSKTNSFPERTDEESGSHPGREPKSSLSGSPLSFKRILVPIDFSECSLHALDYALALAAEFHSQVILLHVVEPTVYPENFAGLSPVAENTNQNLVEAGRERLDQVNRRKVAGRVSTECLVRIGHAHSEITDTAQAMGADLIIIATHGYTGLKHVILGSTTEKVVRHAACPVLTVR
jgi:nucleotide-binding universal stress UspA family protein